MRLGLNFTISADGFKKGVARSALCTVAAISLFAVGCERSPQVNPQSDAPVIAPTSDVDASHQSGGGGEILPSDQSQADRIRRDHITGGNRDHAHTTGEHELGQAHNAGDHGITGEHQAGDHGVTQENTDEQAAGDNGVFNDPTEQPEPSPTPRN